MGSGKWINKKPSNPDLKNQAQVFFLCIYIIMLNLPHWLYAVCRTFKVLCGMKKRWTMSWRSTWPGLSRTSRQCAKFTTVIWEWEPSLLEWTVSPVLPFWGVGRLKEFLFYILSDEMQNIAYYCKSRIFGLTFFFFYLSIRPFVFFLCYLSVSQLIDVVNSHCETCQ